jgi:hypothetical protein
MMIKSKRMRWAGYVTRTGEMINAYQVLFAKRKGNTQLGIYWHRWKNNIKMNLKDITWECLDWIHLAQDRVQWWAIVNTVMNFRAP